jgi:hypothetical protein
MTIKQHGGIFGRNPTFNDVDVDGTLSVGGTALPTPSNIAKLDTAQEFTQEQEIKVSDITAYDATAADAQVTVGPTLFLNNPTNSNTTVAGQVVFGLRSTPYYARLGATGGSIPKIFVGIGTSEIARFTSDGITFNGDTAAANALDDYEEGTWTPTYSTTGTDFTSVTYDSGTTEGTYTKIGNMVNVRVSIRTDAVTIGSASGTVKINGLPFTASSNKNAVGCYSSLFSGDNPRIARAVSDSIFLYYRTSGNTADTPLVPADLGTGTDNNDVIVSLCYQTS